jgi:hypothetical protein
MQLGADAGREFEEFWREQVAAHRVPESLDVDFRPGGVPPTGLALTIPPEVVIAFYQELRA